MAGSKLRRQVDWRWSLERLLFLAAAFSVLGGFVVMAVHSDVAGIDYQSAFWPAGKAVLAGHSPYQASEITVRAGTAFVYPAPAALLFALTSVLPQMLASWIAVILCMALILGTLAVLGVRDWRVYAAVLIWRFAFGAWQTANLTAILGFALALVWRWRDRPTAAALAAVVLLALKPIAWPVLLFFVATKRWRAALLSVLITAAVNIVAWLIVGVSEISAYLNLTRRLEDALWRQGYSVRALAARLGASSTLSELIEVALAVVVAAWLIRLGLQRREREAFTAAVALTLVASPLVWNHYFALVIVPLAIWRPRFDAFWLPPAVLWLTLNRERSDVTLLENLLVWCIVIVLLIGPLLLERRSRFAAER